jgi:hypothetical protein
MELEDRRTLASFRNEAERQTDFYGRRGDEQLTHDWATFAELATLAVQRKAKLVIEMREVSSSPLPIKGCEQHQQLPNSNVIKAFRS